MKWYLFDQAKGSRQKRPIPSKPVLVYLESGNEYLGPSIIVGYMTNASGDKQSPEFITPGVDREGRRVTAWCDCLPDALIQGMFYAAKSAGGKE